MTQLFVNLSMLSAKPTGLGVYAEHCASALGDRFDMSILAGQGAKPRGTVIAQAPASIAMGAGKLAAIRRQFWMRSLRIDPNSLVYSPTHHGLPCQDNQVITVHDLICLRFPSQHRLQYLFFRYGLPRLLRKCRAVFTVSETTKEDLAETYRYPKDRIFVVPNGVDPTDLRLESIERTAEPFLLIVGARYSHKNVDEVLQHSDLWSSRYRLKITSCGGTYRRLLEAEVVARKLEQRVDFLDYVERRDLVQLYRSCVALVYPSKWEGFGIPPLEALACGSPVIASDIPVHREVLGEAAVFVRLGDAESWQEGFAALEDRALIETHLAKAGDLLRRFTWNNSAKALETSLLAVEPGLASRRRTS